MRRGVELAAVVGFDKFQLARQHGHQLYVFRRRGAGIGNRNLVGRIALQVAALRTRHADLQQRRHDFHVGLRFGLQVTFAVG